MYFVFIFLSSSDLTWTKKIRKTKFLIMVALYIVHGFRKQGNVCLHTTLFKVKVPKCQLANNLKYEKSMIYNYFRIISIHVCLVYDTSLSLLSWFVIRNTWKSDIISKCNLFISGINIGHSLYNNTYLKYEIHGTFSDINEL